jgi:predicted methyltransferase
MKRTITALAAGFVLAAAGLALAAETPAAPAAPAEKPATPPESQGDALTNPAFKGPEVLAFIGLKPGDQMADIIAGRFARAFSGAVGPTGKVYAVEPGEIVKYHPEVLTMLSGLSKTPPYTNIVVSTDAIDATALPSGLSAVFIRQNYHDLHDKFMGPANVAAFNRKVFAALKPGGVYVVLDHAAAAGSGLRDTDTLHRIDIASVKSEVTAAGFVLDGESPLFANPADDHTKNVFDPAVRGKTDQFLLRFRKPK